MKSKRTTLGTRSGAPSKPKATPAGHSPAPVTQRELATLLDLERKTDAFAWVLRLRIDSGARIEPGPLTATSEGGEGGDGEPYPYIRACHRSGLFVAQEAASFGPAA